MTCSPAVLLFVILPLSPLPGSAQPPARLCSIPEINTARAEFQRLYDQARYQTAVARLESLRKRCRIEPNPDPDEDQTTALYYWVLSDLGLAKLKAGNASGCLRELAPVATPAFHLDPASFGLENTSVERALRHNYALCEQAMQSAAAEFAATACSLPGAPDSRAGLGLPHGWISGADSACLVLTEAKTEGACPQPTLVAARSGSVSLNPIAVRNGPLPDAAVCCNLSKLAARESGGKHLVRVSSDEDQPVCGGGTAMIKTSAVYELKGLSLLLVRDDSVTVH